MALFKRTQDPVVTAPPTSGSGSIDMSQLGTTIATAVVAALQPMFGQQQPQAFGNQPVVSQEPEDETEEQRITRIANRTFAHQSEDYVHAFNTAVPTLVRNQVVGELSEWDKIIYERHKSDVDREFNRAVGNNPALAANPEAHRVAIRMTLGAHTDEIAALQVERLAPEDLPVHLQPTNASGPSSGPTETLSAIDQNAIDYFNSSSSPQRRNTWDADSLRYYRSIKPGYLHDMVAEHKQRQQALADVQKDK